MSNYNWNGIEYNDDRLFLLQLTKASNGSKQQVIAVVTRRNCQGFPPTRVDEFSTHEEAIEFIKKIEPQAPRISLGGKSPDPTPTYDEHLAWLKVLGVPSSLEFSEIFKVPVTINRFGKEDI